MKILLRILAILSFTIPTTLFAATYYVSTTGTGNYTGQSNSLARNSIQRAISLAQPGDTVSIAAGTYIESSATSAYTSRCGWFDPMIASLCIVRSGTPGNPNHIRAAYHNTRRSY